MLVGIFKFVAFFGVICSIATTATVSIGRVKEKQRFDQASKEEQEQEKHSHEIEDEEDDDEDPVITYTHLDYFVESLTAMKYLKADIDATLTYGSYAIDLNGSLNLNLNISNLEETEASVDLTLGFQNKEFNLSLTYVNSSIYVDALNNHLMMETSSIGEIIDLISSFDIPLSLPEEITNIDTQDLLNRLGSMKTTEYSSYITYEFSLFDNQSPIIFTSDLNHKLTGISTNGLSIGGLSLKLSANANVLDKKIDISNPSTKFTYVNVSGYFGIIKDISDILEEKQFGVDFDISATHNSAQALSLEGKANIDFENMDITLTSTVKAPKMDTSIFARYTNNNIYVNYNDVIKLCFSKTGIGELIYKINSNLQIDSINLLGDLLSSVEIPVVNLIKNKDYGTLISLLNDHVTFKDNEIIVTIPNDLLLGADDELIVLKLSTIDSHLEGIQISNLALDKYLFDMSFNLVGYELPVEPSVDSLEEYDSVDVVNTLIDHIFELTNQKKFAFNINGSLGSTSKGNPITFSGSTQFDIEQMSGGGHISIIDRVNRTHNVDIDVYDVPKTFNNVDDFTESDAKMYFAYNNKLKGSFALKDLRDLISLVSNLLNSNEERWSQYFEAFTNGPLFTLINDAKNGNYENLLVQGLIKSFNLTSSSLEISIDGSLLGQPNTYVSAAIGFASSKITSLNLKTNILDLNLDVTISLCDFDENYARLTIDDSFVDFSDIKVLADYLLKTAELNCFHLTGTIDITLEELSFIDKSANLDLYVGINDDEEVFVKGSLYNIPTMVGVNWKDGLKTSNKFLDFYYDGSGKKDTTNYVYLYASQDVVTWKLFKTETRGEYVKVDETTFVNNILYYICDFGLGFSDTIMNAMSETKERTSPMKIENLLNSYTFDTANNSWFIDLNLRELADNESMSSLLVWIYGDNEGYLSNIKGKTAISAGNIVTIDLLLNAALNRQDNEFPYASFYSYVNAHKNDQDGKEYSFAK